MFNFLHDVIPLPILDFMLFFLSSEGSEAYTLLCSSTEGGLFCPWSVSLIRNVNTLECLCPYLITFDHLVPMPTSLVSVKRRKKRWLIVLAMSPIGNGRVFSRNTFAERL